MDKIKILGFDMDGVLFNFAEQFARQYNRQNKPEKPITSKEIIDGGWDVNATMGKRCNDIWNTPGFFETMPPNEGMAELFRWAYENYHVVVVTTGAYHLHHEKVAAMKKICPEFNDWDIIFTNRKELVMVDALIDDAPHNLISMGERAVAFDMPYNRNVNCKERVYGAKTLRVWIEAHCEEKNMAACS